MYVQERSSARTAFERLAGGAHPPVRPQGMQPGIEAALEQAAVARGLDFKTCSAVRKEKRCHVESLVAAPSKRTTERACRDHRALRSSENESAPTLAIARRVGALRRITGALAAAAAAPPGLGRRGHADDLYLFFASPRPFPPRPRPPRRARRRGRRAPCRSRRRRRRRRRRPPFFFWRGFSCVPPFFGAPRGGGAASRFSCASFCFVSQAMYSRWLRKAGCSGSCALALAFAARSRWIASARVPGSGASSS